ncbi:MAG: isoprenylcysteine carboxylmethyltransferase family protein [Patescibacteria group bacterium]
MEEKKEISKKSPLSESILGLVVYSPVVYLVIFLLSFFVHLRYPITIIKDGGLLPFGLLFIFLAPLIIVWSQKSIKSFVANEQSGKGERKFSYGPYRWSRNPTYVALALLTLGFALIANSLPMLLGTIIAFYIVNIAIVRREEKLLHKKYGDDYEKYKAKVRPWI